ncbi:hypothetical protein PR048_021525 [Dryococelus australis]|uniref:Uncharacterized protein n=1 Tax=Dryococelus australis TaxID=614101 RepID=A0ABQ9GYM7_9NEOP|nr:hypothetical protein PR048_021525 [Dryococelus australis]
MAHNNTIRDHSGAAARTPASHKGEPGSIPGRIVPGFSHTGIVPDDVAGRRVFSGISRHSSTYIPALLYVHLIDSQDPGDKSGVSSVLLETTTVSNHSTEPVTVTATRLEQDEEREGTGSEFSYITDQLRGLAKCIGDSDYKGLLCRSYETNFLGQPRRERPDDGAVFLEQETYHARGKIRQLPLSRSAVTGWFYGHFRNGSRPRACASPSLQTSAVHHTTNCDEWELDRLAAKFRSERNFNPVVRFTSRISAAGEKGKLTADTSSYSVEERLVGSVWAHERRHTGKSIEDARRLFTRRFHKEDPPYLKDNTVLGTQAVSDGINERHTEDMMTNLTTGHMCGGGGICAPISQEVTTQTSIRACNTNNHNVKT